MKSELLVALMVVALLALSAWGFGHVQNQEMPQRIKMATMWLDNRTEDGVRGMVREINLSGANAMAFGVHGNDVMFFNSTVLGLSVTDLAPAIIDESRKHGLMVFVWTDTLNFPEVMDDHPEWEFVTCVRSGRYHYPSDCGWHQRISPFSPGLDDFVREYYRELAGLDIDGIQFQDDLFLAEGEDFSDAAQNAFLDYYGYPPNIQDPVHIDKMQKLKIDRITELTGIAIGAAREVNPDLIFIFDVLAEKEEERMLKWWSIDLQGLRSAGVDYFGIMSYHRQIMQDMRMDLEGSMDYLNSVFQSISGQVGRERVIYRFWTTSFDSSHEPLPEEEVGYVIQRMLDAGAYHIGYFPHHPGMAGIRPYSEIE